MARATQSNADFKGDHISIRMFGGVGDGKEIVDGAIASGSQTYTSAGSSFTAADVGKGFWASGAGAAGGVLKTVIDAVVDANTLTLRDAAGADVSVGHAVYGTDDAPALRAMIATGRTGFIPRPIPGAAFYLLASYDATSWLHNAIMCYLSDRQELFGEGGTVLKVADGALYDTGGVADSDQGGFVLFADQKDYVNVHDLTIDMNGRYNLTPGPGTYLNWPVAFEGGNYNTVERVAVIDCPGRNCITTEGLAFRGHPSSYFTVRDCRCINGGTSLAGNTEQNDFSAIYSEATYSEVSGNLIRHDDFPFAPCGGIELHGEHSRAFRNSFDKCFPDFYVGGDVPGDFSDVDMFDNQSTNCLIGLSHFPQPMMGPAWTSGAVFASGEYVTPTTFNGFNYQAGGAGTTGGSEPSWPTTVGDTVSDGGITWTCTTAGDFYRIRYRRNRVRLNTNPNFSSQAPWCVSQFRDDTGHFNYRGVLHDCEYSDNTVSDDSQPGAALSVFARLSATDGVMLANNMLSSFGAEPFTLIGSPYHHKNVTIRGGKVRDFGLNSGLFDHAAVLIDLTGSAVDPPAAHYDLDGLTFEDVDVQQTTAAVHDSVFLLSYGGSSVVQNLNVQKHLVRNVATLASGPSAGLVPYVNTPGVVPFLDSSNQYQHDLDLQWDSANKILHLLKFNPLVNFNGKNSFGFGGISQGTGNPFAISWTSTTVIPPFAGMHPTTPNGFVYYTIAGGTTAGSEPTWPTTAGSTVTDGSVVWICSASGANPPAGYGQYACCNCYWDGANWRQPCGALDSYAFGATLHLGWVMLYAAFGSVNDGIVKMLPVAQMDSTGTWVTGGNSQGPIRLVRGYGAVGTSSTDLAIGAGGSSPNVISFCWGDGTGYKMVFGYISGGVFTPVFTITDNGTIDPIKTNLTASRPVKTDSSKVLIASKIDLTQANDVSLGSISTGDMLVAAAGGVIGSGGTPVAVGAGVASGDMLKMGASGELETMTQAEACAWLGFSVGHTHNTSAPASHSHSIPTGSSGSSVGSVSTVTAGPN